MSARGWWVGLRCRWCGRTVTASAADGAWRHPHDGRPPYAEHFRCREEAAER